MAQSMTNVRTPIGISLDFSPPRGDVVDGRTPDADFGAITELATLAATTRPNARTPSSLPARQVDQHHVGVLSDSIEQNPFAIGRQIEAFDGETRLQVGELSSSGGLEIEQPEILPAIVAPDKDNLLAVGQQTVSIAATANPERWD
jgi:hypothetical protein